VGFEVIDKLSSQWGIPVKSREAHSRLGLGEVEGHSVLLAKPQTYMNESGRALQSLQAKWNLPLTNFLVVCDDIHLPLGKLRLRRSGSHGGHNGLRSIIQCLGTNEFPRLRIGIGGEEIPPAEWVKFVLSPFEREERAAIDQAIARATEVVTRFIRDGIEAAMNWCNA